MTEANRAARAEARSIQTFQFLKPYAQSAPRAEIELCGNEMVRATGHVILRGEIDNLHYESGVDEVWVVLKGRARFCRKGRTLIGEFGIGEGILIPRESPYFVESIGEDDLEMVQVAVPHPGARDDRVDVMGPEEEPLVVERHSGRAL